MKQSAPSMLARHPFPLNRLVTFVLLAVVGGAADLISKQMIFSWRGLPGQRDPYWIIEGYFGIETAVNIGAVFGLGAGQGSIFAALSVIAGIGISVWLFWFGAAQSKWLTVALGLVAGGIIGNLYDRLGLWWKPGYLPEWQSGVRDWILWQASDEWVWPNFNIADSLLVVGACMLFYQSLMQPTTETDETKTEPTDETETGGTQAGKTVAKPADTAAPPTPPSPTSTTE